MFVQNKPINRATLLHVGALTSQSECLQEGCNTSERLCPQNTCDGQKTGGGERGQIVACTDGRERFA